MDGQDARLYIVTLNKNLICVGSTPEEAKYGALKELGNTGEKRTYKLCGTASVPYIQHPRWTDTAWWKPVYARAAQEEVWKERDRIRKKAQREARKSIFASKNGA